jgi:hypothetical protein
LDTQASLELGERKRKSKNLISTRNAPATSKINAKAKMKFLEAIVSEKLDN